MTRVPKALRPLAAAAMAQGWRITPTGSGHLRWEPPTGRPVITASTMRDGRSALNIRADLRRAGLRTATP
jgi:hypothetical protein